MKMKYWPFTGHLVIHHQPNINWSESENDIICIASLTKFRFFEFNLDTLNIHLSHFSLFLCWEIGPIDPLIPSLMTWLHRSQVTKCCLVSGLITEVSWISPLLKENATGVATGVLGAGIMSVFRCFFFFLKCCTVSNPQLHFSGRGFCQTWMSRHPYYQSA